MIAYIIRRLFQLVIVLFGVTLITFGMLKLVPGDPALMLAGKNPTPERVAFIRHDRGLDRPFYVQYVKYVQALVRGDFGESLYTSRPVAEMIKEAAPVTIQLAIAAVLIELLGIPLGVYSALRQYSFWDTALTTTALILWGIPVFVLGYFAMYIFGLKLGWFPIGGVGPTVLGIIPSTWESWQKLILPAVTLGLIEVAYISYMQRASMLEVSRSDFIRTARAKGLSERKVIWGHGFKNAVIPVMTIAGIDLGRSHRWRHHHGDGVQPSRHRAHDLPRDRGPGHGGHRRRRAVRDLLLRVRQPARGPRLRLGGPARPPGGLTHA